MRSTTYRISRADLVLLWAKAAGMCSHPNCSKRLVLEARGAGKDVVVGEAAHIVAKAAGGPRGDKTFDKDHIDRYSNLILLCGDHHAEIDKSPEQHPKELLRSWKAEHERWVVAAIDQARRGTAWTAIVQDPDGRINWNAARKAIGAGDRVSAVRELCGMSLWEEGVEVEKVLAETPAEERRFAVFSLGPIPNAVQLGYLLSDRFKVKLFHYHRDRGTWAWPDEEEAGGTREGDPLEVRESLGTAAAMAAGGGEGILRVSLSGPVPAQKVAGAAADVEIAARQPSVRWLKRPGQLTELEQAYERALQRLRACARIHLYYAGPAAGAIAFGRAYNPRMNPPVVVYRYWRPVYQQELVLNDDGG